MCVHAAGRALLKGAWMDFFLMLIVVLFTNQALVYFLFFHLGWVCGNERQQYILRNSFHLIQNSRSGVQSGCVFARVKKSRHPIHILRSVVLTLRLPTRAYSSLRENLASDSHAASRGSTSRMHRVRDSKRPPICCPVFNALGGVGCVATK